MTNSDVSNTGIRVNIKTHEFLREFAYQNRTSIKEAISFIIEKLKSEIEEGKIYFPKYKKVVGEETKNVRISETDRLFLESLAFHKHTKIKNALEIIASEYEKRNN
ncbi:hypothetical protein M3573_18930 [Bacillus safensis]|uniref:hypothetical protein n=1 Tax=Bacillus safensis TaxID=561879 RepID=UPI002041ABA8|nr:hypothetical protein [Bacillus safensis]MCM3140353.1 hypothetical protein [Bacillus safensis]